jgi:hypothetical protein
MTTTTHINSQLHHDSQQAALNAALLAAIRHGGHEPVTLRQDGQIFLAQLEPTGVTGKGPDIRGHWSW